MPKTRVPDNIDKELVARSVTKNDHLTDIRKNGVGSVMYFNIMPNLGASLASTNANLPPYWSHWQDRVLRSTVHFEGFWASVVDMWISKVASQDWSVKGVRVQRVQEFLLNDWTTLISKFARDFLTTNNGAFLQIVRASNASGSRIIGLVNLDSCRTTRTGDPSYPVLYQDLLGKLHALRDYEVISLVDMPSPADQYYGVGICAAQRSFDSIINLASIEQLVGEKVSGSEPNAISLINANLDEGQLSTSISSGKQERVQQGYVRNMGVILVPIVNMDSPPTVATIQLKGLPEGFDSEKERENGHRKYALATGLDPQIINPRLIGSGSRGTSAQSDTLQEQQQGNLPALFRKGLTHLLNTWVVPNSTVFAFGIKDLQERKLIAEIQKLDAEARKVQIESGEITPNQAREMAVRNDELPARFISSEVSIDSPLSDTDKGDEVSAELEAPVESVQTQPSAELQMKQYRAKLAIARALSLDEDSRATVKQWADTIKNMDAAQLLVAQEQYRAQQKLNGSARRKRFTRPKNDLSELAEASAKSYEHYIGVAKKLDDLFEATEIVEGGNGDTTFLDVLKQMSTEST